MQFAKLFTVAGSRQLLAVLQPDDTDGEWQVVMTTYVDATRISFASRLPADPDGRDSDESRAARMREVFEAFDQEAADAAWLVAVRLAQRRQRPGAARPSRTGATPGASKAGDLLGAEPAEPIALGVESYPSDELRGWLDGGTPSGTLH